MTDRRSLIFACATVAALGIPSCGGAHASDFSSYFSRYVPASIRYEIEGYAKKQTVAKPKHEQGSSSTSLTGTEPAKPIPAAGAAGIPPLTAASNTCLSEHHLATGVVLFKDSCSKEWAINATNLAEHPVDRKCLRKDHHPNGIVMFKDVCTEEWAMNTTDAARPQAEPQE